MCYFYLLYYPLNKSTFNGGWWHRTSGRESRAIRVMGIECPQWILNNTINFTHFCQVKKNIIAVSIIYRIHAITINNCQYCLWDRPSVNKQNNYRKPQELKNWPRTTRKESLVSRYTYNIVQRKGKISRYNLEKKYDRYFWLIRPTTVSSNYRLIPWTYAD